MLVLEACVAETFYERLRQKSGLDVMKSRFEIFYACRLLLDDPALESQEAKEARLAFIQEYEQSGPHDTVEVASNE
jgi:hypothetical protein